MKAAGRGSDPLREFSPPGWREKVTGQPGHTWYLVHGTLYLKIMDDECQMMNDEFQMMM
jgi:hypothetical protein